MSSDVIGACLTERQMLLSVSPWEFILIGCIVPILILFGISGNILNLTVLLAKNMRTRSNILLAMLAVTDVVFLFCMIPHSMANHRIFAFNYYFRSFYLHYKFFLLAILNWASAAAIWLILVICLERLYGIRKPLHAQKRKYLLSPTFLVSFIVFFTGLLTSYHHFSHQCVFKKFCNGTQPHGHCLPSDGDAWFRNASNPNPEWFRSIVRWSPHVNAVFVVFVPIILVGISNVLLIATMRQRTNFFANKSTEQTMAQNKTEQKVTLTVCAIVTCFTITQGPSAVIPVVASIWNIAWESTAEVASITSTMVVLGKALNFVLFCLSSTSFRQRLFFRTKESIMRRRTTARKQSTTNTTRLDSLANSPVTPLMRKDRRDRARSLHENSVTAGGKPRGNSVSVL